MADEWRIIAKRVPSRRVRTHHEHVISEMLPTPERPIWRSQMSRNFFRDEHFTEWRPIDNAATAMPDRQSTRIKASQMARAARRAQRQKRFLTGRWTPKR